MADIVTTVRFTDPVTKATVQIILTATAAGHVSIIASANDTLLPALTMLPDDGAAVLQSLSRAISDARTKPGVE